MIAGILVACLQPITSKIEERALATDMRKCPYCAELVKAEAKICRYCQRELLLDTNSPMRLISYDGTAVTSTPSRCLSCGAEWIICLVDQVLYQCGKCGKRFRVTQSDART